MNKLTGITLTLIAAALAGCGGGGGGDAGTAATLTTTPTATVAATSVSGVASKGIVKQAKVLVCRIANGVPEADASCASTTSGNDGSYTVSFSDGYTGPAMVKVMAGAASTMIDETNGTDVPYNMTMRAVVPAVGATTIVHVTPFSEMAANAASMTAMDATTIRQSIDAVESAMTTLGLDMSVMPMIDLKNDASDSAALTAQANMIKQLARVAMAAKNSSQLHDRNGAACNAAGTTTSEQIACAVTAMADVMDSYVTADSTKSAALLAALNAQDPTSVGMPILRADGIMAMEIADMTSFTSMQAAMEQAGMGVTDAANTTNTMMGGMR